MFLCYDRTNTPCPSLCVRPDSGHLLSTNECGGELSADQAFLMRSELSQGRVSDCAPSSRPIRQTQHVVLVSGSQLGYG